VPAKEEFFPVLPLKLTCVLSLQKNRTPVPTPHKDPRQAAHSSD